MFNPANYQIKSGYYQGKNVIWIRFEYTLNLKTELKKALPKARWIPLEKAWCVMDTSEHRDILALEHEVYHPSKLIERIPISNKENFKRFLDELKLKGYSENTIKTYCNEFAQLLIILKSVDVNSLTPERLRAYLLYCINELHLSENLIHSRLNALKFYFEKVLHQPKFFMEIPRPKKKSQLPKVLSQRDIKKLFQSVDNLKHLLLLKLCYGMGLRVSELVHLQIKDIDSHRMQVHIRASKNKKDRYVNLPETILTDLREYYKEYRPETYLFEGQEKGEPYSIRSVQQVFKNAMQRAKINKTIGIHGLRHSYATHLLEYGTDISFIRDLLGHKDIKTTLIYTNVSQKQLQKISSPLDRME